MRERKARKIISAILSVQMVLSVLPFGVSNANAAELMYLNDSCTEVSNKWTGAKDKLTVMNDEEISYLRYSATDSEQKTTRKVDTTLPDGGVYIAELDARFADASSGIIELY